MYVHNIIEIVHAGISFKLIVCVYLVSIRNVIIKVFIIIIVFCSLNSGFQSNQFFAGIKSIYLFQQTNNVRKKKKNNKLILFAPINTMYM